MAVLLLLHFLRTEVLLLHGVCLPVGNSSFSLPFVNNFMKNKGLCDDRHAYLFCDKLKVPAVVQIIFTNVYLFRRRLNIFYSTISKRKLVTVRANRIQ